MRTSLNEIRDIENFLLHAAAPEENLLMDARLIVDRELRRKVSDQQKVYAAVQSYGRKKLREKLERVHRRLFAEPDHADFKQKIMRLFSRRR